MRHILFLMLCLPLVAAHLSAAESSAIPPGAQRALDRYQADVDRAQADLLKALEKEEVAATKRGDLDGALAIRSLKSSQARGEAPNEAGDSSSSAVIKKGMAPRLIQAIPTLTDADWDELQGTVHVIRAAAGPTDIGLTVQEGEAYIWIPHPSDRWDSVTWQGYLNMPRYNNTAYNAMQMLWSIGATSTDAFLITGSGSVRFQANATNFANKIGDIRIKVMKVE